MMSFASLASRFTCALPCQAPQAAKALCLAILERTTYIAPRCTSGDGRNIPASLSSARLRGLDYRWWMLSLTTQLTVRCRRFCTRPCISDFGIGQRGPMRMRRAGFHASLPHTRSDSGPRSSPWPQSFLCPSQQGEVFMPINKCFHGVYIPEGESRAPYCQICTPGGPAETRAVVLPRSSSDPLTTADRVMANKRPRMAAVQNAGARFTYAQMSAVT